MNCNPDAITKSLHVPGASTSLWAYFFRFLCGKPRGNSWGEMTSTL